METIFACFSQVEVYQYDEDTTIDAFEPDVCVFSSLEKARLSLEEYLNSMTSENEPHIDVKLIHRTGGKQWNVVNEWEFEELDEEGDPTTGETWIIREMEIK